MAQSIFQAQPLESPFDPRATILIIIDMQRDFVEAGGFDEVLGNDVSLVRTVIAPCTEAPAATHQKGITAIHTRGGHRADLSDCPPAKLTHGERTFVGELGPTGRILVRGEAGHGIVSELYPMAGEPATDKPNRGALYQADLRLILQNHDIKTLIACGVTAEVHATTTVCGANDRGYECIIPGDCVDSYLPEFQKYVPEMIKAQGAIFGQVTDSKATITGLED